MTSRRQWRNGAAQFPSSELESLPAGLRSIFTSGSIPARFFHYFIADNVIEEVHGVPERRLARFGFTRSKDHVAVTLDTFEVLQVRAGGSMEATLINSTLSAFSDFMSYCERRYPYYDVNTGEADLSLFTAASRSLKSELELIDPRAFATDSYWSDFLSDVGRGNFGEPTGEEEA
jgi:SUKH-4 immunity protein